MSFLSMYSDTDTAQYFSFAEVDPRYLKRMRGGMETEEAVQPDDCETISQYSNLSHFQSLSSYNGKSDMGMFDFDHPYAKPTPAETNIANVRDPPSYYHVEEMNKIPVEQKPRLARQPSQYQMETLAESYFIDYPMFSVCAASTETKNLKPTHPAQGDVELSEQVEESPTHEAVISQYMSQLLV